MRLGAVSPPPPGAGSRFRSQTCWQSTPCGGSEYDDAVLSRVPSLTPNTINSLDIISNVNRIRTNGDKPPAHQTTSIVREHVLHSGKCLLKNQVKRCALVRPQVYTRLSEYGDANSIKDNSTLDRLPRFRFGGNRASSNDKWPTEQRYADLTNKLTNRLKRNVNPVPVPPPRNRHSNRSTPQTSPTPPQEPSEFVERHVPHRCASLSSADLIPAENKYNVVRETSTLPKLKSSSRPTTPTLRKPLDNTSDKLKLLRNEEPVGLLNEFPSTPQSSEDSSSSNDKKRDKLRRRKGIYISQWPNTYQEPPEGIPQFNECVEFSNVTGSDQLQNSLEHISRLQLQDSVDSNVFCSCSSQDEPLSPEDNSSAPEWPTVREPPTSISPENLREPPRILCKSDSLSEGEPDYNENKLDQISLVPSDLSDCENKNLNIDIINPNISRRYWKRPLRGPYGQMLEAEMKKPENKKNLSDDLRFLDDLTSNNLNKSKPNKQKCTYNNSLDETISKEKAAGQWFLKEQVNQRKLSADSLVPPTTNDKKNCDNHQRTSSSPSKFTNIEVSTELLEELLRGSSEQLAAAEAQQLQNVSTILIFN